MSNLTETQGYTTEKGNTFANYSDPDGNQNNSFWDKLQGEEQIQLLREETLFTYEDMQTEVEEVKVERS